MKTLKKDTISWYGYHGYVSSKHMPGELGITEAFRVITPLSKKPITFRFSHPVEDVHGNLHSWLFEGDAPAGHVLSITVANDMNLL